MRMRTIIVSIVLGAVLWAAVGAAAATLWSRFQLTSGSSHVTRLYVKSRCLNGEDSASHLRLRSYATVKIFGKWHGVASYTCTKRGY